MTKIREPHTCDVMLSPGTPLHEAKWLPEGHMKQGTAAHFEWGTARAHVMNLREGMLQGTWQSWQCWACHQLYVCYPHLQGTRQQVQEEWSLIWGMEGALGLRLWEQVVVQIGGGSCFVGDGKKKKKKRKWKESGYESLKYSTAEIKVKLSTQKKIDVKVYLLIFCWPWLQYCGNEIDCCAVNHCWLLTIEQQWNPFDW